MRNLADEATDTASFVKVTGMCVSTLVFFLTFFLTCHLSTVSYSWYYYDSHRERITPWGFYSADTAFPTLAGVYIVLLSSAVGQAATMLVCTNLYIWNTCIISRKHGFKSASLAEFKFGFGSLHVALWFSANVAACGETAGKFRVTTGAILRYRAICRGHNTAPHGDVRGRHGTAAAATDGGQHLEHRQACQPCPHGGEAGVWQLGGPYLHWPC